MNFETKDSSLDPPKRIIASLTATDTSEPADHLKILLRQTNHRFDASTGNFSPEKILKLNNYSSISKV